MESIWKSDTSPPALRLVKSVMWKLRGTILLIVVLWVAGAMGYKAASAEKLRANLVHPYGPGVVVEKITFTETYGSSENRRGEAVFSVPARRDDPRNPRGFSSQKMVLLVETRGRWWPGLVQHGTPKIMPPEKPTP